MEEWEASGLSGLKFAERHGLTVRTLYGWRQRLEDEAEVALVEQPPEAFTEVRVREAEAGTSPGSIEIVARGGRLIRVVGPVDVEQLRATIEAVEGC